MNLINTKSIICSVLIITSFFCGGILRKNIDAANTSENMSIKNIQTGYIVREINGFIGIYRKNETHPIKTLDIIVTSLPEEDQRMLNDGIYIQNDEELISLIEDYTG